MSKGTFKTSNNELHRMLKNVLVNQAILFQTISELGKETLGKNRWESRLAQINHQLNSAQDDDSEKE